MICRVTWGGGCNPSIAFAAISADPSVGLLLPCNVTVERRDETHSLVRLTDPRAMLAAAPRGQSDALKAVAADGHQRMERVVAALRRVPQSRAGQA